MSVVFKFLGTPTIFLNISLIPMFLYFFQQIIWEEQNPKTNKQKEQIIWASV